MHSLQPILDQVLDGAVKGFPIDRRPLRLGDLASTRWGLFTGDLDTPVALLKKSTMAENAKWMNAFLKATGASLCPHGKTTMAPQLFHQQLKDGAWGMTLATPQQVQVALDFGIQRIILANEVVSDAAISWLRRINDDTPDLELWTLVDSLEGVARLAGHPGKRPLNLLLEIGVPGGRCGVREKENALEIARAIKACPSLKLCGIEAFEGIIITKDSASDLTRIDAWLDFMGDLAIQCSSEGLFEGAEVLLTAGGSAYFDRVAARFNAVELDQPKRVMLRSGCYITLDAGHYKRLVQKLEGRLPEESKVEGHLQGALEVWGRVLSRPEKGLALLDFGKRDAGYDIELPKPIYWARPGEHNRPQKAGEDWTISALHDQHACLKLPEDAELAIGDLVGCAISHPCTTFDKWQLMYVVDDNYRVLEGIRTFF